MITNKQKEQVIEAVNSLHSTLCGNIYDCDADWCPLEVLVGLSGLKGNRCHLQRLVDDINKQKIDNRE